MSDAQTELPVSAFGADQPITILTRLDVEAAAGDSFAALIEAFAQSVRDHEPDCTEYRILRAAGAPLAVVILARYTRFEAYLAHLEGSHTKTIMRLLEPMLVG